MKQRIRERQDKLEQVRLKLKEQFFGIDEQLDKIIGSITAWYTCPEIITRPVIVNLWGLTGVGKTSVVRALVGHLGVSDKYLELQMTGDEKNTIAECLEKSNIDDRDRGVILLDEFQRFRTRASDGTDIKPPSTMSDVWMLLSDGRFSYEGVYKKLNTLLSTLSWRVDDYHYESRRFSKGKRDTQPDVPRSLNITYHKDEILCLKKYLNLDIDPGDICEIDNIELTKMIKDFIKNNPSLYLDYTKCLIFVSGNLDELFKVAEDAGDCDTDADIFHEYTKKISVIDVKKSLGVRFRPEQIARLGNDHIIYPSLDKETYNKLIVNNCNEYVDTFEKLTNVSIVIKPELYDAIYENAVYPTQGTRPVFSTVQKVFSAPLSRGMLWCIENDYNKVHITVCKNPSVVRFECGYKYFDVPINLDVEDQRKKYSDDYTALLAVHESGHAVVYAELFKAPPKEVKINVASFTGGYNLMDSKANCRASILNGIAVSMAGIAAEEIIFGQDNRSSGCMSDISKATMSASSFVRNLGMNGINGHVQVDGFTCTIRGTDESDTHIEEILKEQKKRAIDIVNKNRSVLIDLSRYLVNNKKITDEEFKLKYKDNFIFEESAKDVHGKYYELLLKA